MKQKTSDTGFRTEIKTLWKSGLKPAQIAQQLNDKGIVGGTGKPWQALHVGKVLSGFMHRPKKKKKKVRKVKLVTATGDQKQLSFSDATVAHAHDVLARVYGVVPLKQFLELQETVGKW